ncbi:MAG: hypothetical protein DRJ68_06845 [Thermoprotei archaeon]|nr:MAG: hypothetical protein DRJ68_06845 [Thermoprotei archaeon]
MKERIKIKKLIDEVFRHYASDIITKEEFEKYFTTKGLSKEEIEELWVNAMAENLIEVGIQPKFPDEAMKSRDYDIVFEKKKKLIRLL